MGLLSYFGLKRESLSTPAPSDDYWYGPTGNQTPAGVRVDEAKAMTYSVCWAATSLLAGTGGLLPLNLHRRKAGGGSEIDYGHRVHQILHDEPNPEMPAMTFRSSRFNHQINRGNGFAEIIRNRGGEVLHLYPIHASRIPVDTNIKRVNGRILYLVNNDNGTKTEIWQENMFHVPSVITDDGIIGRGVIENARLTIGMGIATEMHSASFFGNYARPPIVVKDASFKKPEDAEAFRRMWMETHGGPSNTGKPALLPPGADITTLPFNAQEAQFLESRQHTVEELCRWYGVPPHLVHHLLRMTNNNIEHVGIDFVKYSLMRWLKLWEQEVWRKLLTPDERKTHYAKFNVDALERGDKASRTAAMVQEVFNGKRTINEWRELDDENPIGPLGDIHWVQQPMVPIEVAAKGPAANQPVPEPEPEKPEPTDDGLSALRDELRAVKDDLAGTPRGDDTLTKVEQLSQILKSLEVEQSRTKQTQQKLAQAMVRDAKTRMLSIEIHNVKHIAEKPKMFTQRLQDFYDRHSLTMTRSLMEPVSVMLMACGDQREPAEVVQTITTSHVSESLRQILDLTNCQAEELPAKVDECLSKWHEERVTVTL